MGPSYGSFICSHLIPEDVHVLFSVPHACHVLGLLDDPFPRPRRGAPPKRTPVERWEILRKTCAEQWELEKGDQEFLAQLATLGITPASITARGAMFHGAVIGWDPYRTFLPAVERKAYAIATRSMSGLEIDPIPIPAAAPALCTDLELTLAILSRCVADLLIAHRTPSLEVDTLFTTTFCTVDRRFADVAVQPLPTDDWVNA